MSSAPKKVPNPFPFSADSFVIISNPFFSVNTLFSIFLNFFQVFLRFFKGPGKVRLRAEPSGPRTPFPHAKNPAGAGDHKQLRWDSNPYSRIESPVSLPLDQGVRYKARCFAGSEPRLCRSRTCSKYCEERIAE